MIDVALEKGLPANLEFERMVLGAVMMDGQLFTQVHGGLLAEDFFLEKHRRIFLRMGEIHERGDQIDRVTVANELLKHNQLESIGGVTYLCEMDEGLPTLVNLDGYTRVVAEKALLRRGALLANKLSDEFLMAADSPAELLSRAEHLIRELGQKANGKAHLASASDVISAIDLNQLGRAPLHALKTPYPALNRQVVGFCPGELVVLGSRPSAGKSTMGLEIAVSVAETGSPAVIFSLEMRKEALIMRAACNRGQVDNSNLRHGRLRESERHALLVALNELREMPLYIDDSAQTFPAMAQAVRKMPVRPRLVVVDHLHLMRTVGRHENRNNELASVTRDLKLFAGEMGLSSLLLAQLNRSSEKENRPPSLHDLRECGAIEADADVVLFLHRKETVQTEDKKGSPVPVDLLLAKQREGAAYIQIPMMLHGKFYKFYECDQQRREVA